MDTRIGNRMRGGGAALVAFAKDPDRVPVKTRLAKSIGKDLASRIYSALLEDCLISMCAVSGATPYLACYPDYAGIFFQQLQARYKLRLIGQNGADLGERMLGCAKDLLKAHSSVIVFGTDVPGLPILPVQTAITANQSWDVLLGPCGDGGYYALGVKQVDDSLLAGIEWGTSSVLVNTVNNCRGLGLKVSFLDILDDVDDERALSNLCRQLKQEDFRDGALTTRRLLEEEGYLLGGTRLVVEKEYDGKAAAEHSVRPLYELVSDSDFADFVICYGRDQKLSAEYFGKAEVENLSGNINRVRRVHLPSNTGKSESYIVKHVPSGGRLERYPSIVFPENRLSFEILWYELCKSSWQEVCVKTPEILYFGNGQRTIIMEDLNPQMSFGLACQRNDGNIERQLNNLGRFLGRVHRASIGTVLNNPGAALNRPFVFTRPIAEPEQMRAIWQAGEQQLACNQTEKAKSTISLSEQICLQQKYLRLSAAAVLPVLVKLENRFNRDSPAVLTHGDLHADSVLLLQDGNLAVIDAELCDTGTPAFDLGTLCAHVRACMVAGGRCQADVSRALNAFLSGYGREFWSDIEPCRGEIEALMESTALHCGAEILRRLLGAAGFSCNPTLSQRKSLLDDATELLLSPHRCSNKWSSLLNIGQVK